MTAAMQRQLDQRISEMDRRIQQRFDSEERARSVAFDSLDARLKLLNELRGNVLTRDEFEAKHGELDRRIQRAERLVYIGVGGVAVLEVILRFLK